MSVLDYMPRKKKINKEYGIFLSNDANQTYFRLLLNESKIHEEYFRVLLCKYQCGFRKSYSVINVLKLHHEGVQSELCL